MNEIMFRMLNGWAHQNAFADTVIVFMAEYVPILLLVIALVFLIVRIRAGRAGTADIIAITLTMIIAGALSDTLKALFEAPRPFITLDGVNLLVTHGAYDSFPSGHATVFSALAGALFFFSRTLGWVFAVGALLIGVARIMAGIHFPIDIMAGFALGIFSALLARAIVRRFTRTNV